ncbi:hypothetical protein PVAG01_06585 [Phlyctema vagabunda]|uniref:Stc1 domain-containing protein n=1 Tax=Phlyctema vagabunda TaxID=108571 RepID=A0ABR4PGL0_9HELO
MPVNNQKFYDMTAEQRKAIPLLPNFVCSRCSKTKSNSQFSKSETNKYAAKVANGQSVNAVTAKLACRTCKGEQRQELECEYCHVVKVLDEFSMSQRRSSRWCKECISWKESAEPGLMTKPAPNSVLAPDEDEAFASGYDDPFGEHSDDSDTYDGSDNVEDGVSIGESRLTNGHSLAGPMSGLEIGRRQTTASNPYEARLQQKTASVGSWSTADPRRVAGGSAQRYTSNAQAARRDALETITPVNGTSKYSGPASTAHLRASRPTENGGTAPGNASKQVDPRRSKWAKPNVAREVPEYNIRRPIQQPRDQDESDNDDDFNHDN